MNRFTKTQKVCAFATVLLLASGGAYYTLFSTIESLQGDLTTLRSAVNAETLQDQEDLRVANLVSSTRAERALLDAYLLPVSNPTPFLSLLESLGLDAGVKIEVDSLTDHPPAKGVQGQTTVQVVLKVEGTFSGLYHLLTLIEHMPYNITVTNVSFSSSKQESGWRGQVHLLVTASAL